MNFSEASQKYESPKYKRWFVLIAAIKRPKWPGFKVKHVAG